MNRNCPCEAKLFRLPGIDMSGAGEAKGKAEGKGQKAKGKKI
jgi:hypothetical protein